VETVGIAYFREAEFYYNRNELFYIKYKAINFVNKIEEMKYYNLFIFELEKGYGAPNQRPQADYTCHIFSSLAFLLGLQSKFFILNGPLSELRHDPLICCYD
jgi:hypothetical protein